MKNTQTSILLIGAIVIGIGIGYGAGFVSFAKEGRHDDVREMNGMGMMHHQGHGAMQDAMHDMTMSLEGKTGDVFDQAFLREMIIHHEGAVTMAQMVVKQSNRQELKDLAQDIIDAQTKEIEMMRTWQQAWGSTTTTTSAPTPTKPVTTQPVSSDGVVACTMDAKICPDGSAVGRQGPRCEFAKCPGE